MSPELREALNRLRSTRIGAEGAEREYDEAMRARRLLDEHRVKRDEANARFREALDNLFTWAAHDDLLEEVEASEAAAESIEDAAANAADVQVDQAAMDREVPW